MDDSAIIAASWNDFYRQNRPGVPFLRNVPDENLVEWIDTGKCASGRALDVGCGLGRNSIFLAQNGWRVDALDLSAEALGTARARAAAAAIEVDFVEADVFDGRWPAGGYDLIYDSGCLHHAPPGDRDRWLSRYVQLLRPGGQLALVVFAPDSGAPIESDTPPRPGSRTGWAFTEEGLRDLLAARFAVEVLRRMSPQEATAQRMGVDFLWVALAHRR